MGPEAQRRWKANWSFLTRKAGFAVATLVVLSFLCYLLAFSSGSHLQALLTERLSGGGRVVLTPAQIQAVTDDLVRYYHHGQPLYVGYFSWLGEVLQGNLGQSVAGGPVVSEVAPWIIPTVMLQVPAVVTSLLLGLVLGVFAASRRGSLIDRMVNGASAMTFGIPSFWLAIVGIVVISYGLRLLPSFGAYSPYPPYWWGSQTADAVAHYILPFSVLVVVSTPLYLRVARASALEVLSKDWVRSMTLASVGRRRIIYRHVLKNSAGPALALFAYNLAIFLAAAPGIEIAFGWPGLGLRFVEASLEFDQPTMLAIIMIMGLVAVAASFVVDAIQAAIDPRVSLA